MPSISDPTHLTLPSQDLSIPLSNTGSNIHPEVRPFLKWAGGKTQLLPYIRMFYPKKFGTYFEPFVGGGAVFFDLLRNKHLETCDTKLLDTNSDVIGCYLQIRDHVEQVIDHLKQLELGHRKRRDQHFYEIRDKKFNPLRKHLGIHQKQTPHYTPELAAMSIYLNRTGFNGLFRLNSSGLFNVPMGRYSNPKICDSQNLRHVATALARPKLEIKLSSFELIRSQIIPGDFIYFDPPYLPISETAKFTSYTANNFGLDDHMKLQKLVIELAQRDCLVLLSNSTAPEITGLYHQNDDAKKAGLKAH